MTQPKFLCWTLHPFSLSPASLFRFSHLAAVKFAPWVPDLLDTPARAILSNVDPLLRRHTQHHPYAPSCVQPGCRTMQSIAHVCYWLESAKSKTQHAFTCDLCATSISQPFTRDPHALGFIHSHRHRTHTPVKEDSERACVQSLTPHSKQSSKISRLMWRAGARYLTLPRQQVVPCAGCSIGRIVLLPR